MDRIRQQETGEKATSWSDTLHCAGVPEEEAESLMLTMADALDHAAAGERARGYLALMRGLTRAEALLLQGKRWAAGLIGCWREAIDRYSGRVDSALDQDEAELDLESLRRDR